MAEKYHQVRAEYDLDMFTLGGARNTPVARPAPFQPIGYHWLTPDDVVAEFIKHYPKHDDKDIKAALVEKLKKDKHKIETLEPHKGKVRIPFGSPLTEALGVGIPK